MIDAGLEQVKFSTKWNARRNSGICKLDLQCFTTVRLQNPKYEVGNVHLITLVNKKGEPLVNYGKAEIVVVKPFLLKNVSEGIARIDTGYSKEAFVKMVKTIYKRATVNLDIHPMVLVVYSYLDNEGVDITHSLARNEKGGQ